VPYNPLPARGPDVLQEPILLRQSVDAIIRLAHSADESAQSIRLVLAGVSAVLVDLCDGDLDRSVVLGLDDAVGCAALAGDVPRRVVLVMLWFGLRVVVALVVSGGDRGGRTGQRVLRVRSPF